MKFLQLNLTDKEIFDRYTGNYINSESSFTNIMMWNESYFHAEYAICCDSLIIKFAGSNGKQRFSMPYGNSNNTIPALLELCKHCRNQNMQLEILDGNQKFVDAVISSGMFNIEYTQNRDYQEYVYLSENLAVLSGKEMHSKKNHVNKFKRMYNYKFVPIDASIVPLCLQKAEMWLDKKYNGNKQEYSKEIRSIRIALNNFEYFKLFGGAIFVGEDLAAFTVGEELNPETVLVHIEKADIGYQGAFAAINYEFASYVQPKYKYLNREEDMGIEGLRKAKMSYRPAFLTDKYKCIIKERN